MYTRRKTADGRCVQYVDKRGYDVIRDPLLNKGTGFTARERRELNLEGILPHEIHTQKTQIDRVYRRLSRIDDDLKKYEAVSALQDRNEQLFYSLLCAHLEELMPIIYTPTVGRATKAYSQVYRRARGVWITPEHVGRVGKILRRAGHGRSIRLIVVTDNESILGIGDQGAGGMAISVGKLSLYCAAAGIHPSETLPVSLDVGTENEELLNDPLYLGWRERRLRGEAYDALVDEFVSAVKTEFSGAFLQWEDFRQLNAVQILDRYRCELPSFNDDIQGTGAVGLAAIESALRVSGEALENQRIVILGAGAAGLGMYRQISSALASCGLDADERSGALAVLDSRGLLVDNGTLTSPYKAEMAWTPKLATHYGLMDQENRGLQSVVERYRPTALIGASGQSGAFDERVIKTMAQHCERPIVLPFSNPTELSEAEPKDVYEWTQGRALVATGSPFAAVEHGGRTIKVGQGNNAFIFPGLGLAVLLSGAREVTNEMISAASEALAQSVHDDELEQGLLFPAIERLRDVSQHVAVNVIRSAVAHGLCDAPAEDLEAYVAEHMWQPVYPNYLPV